MKIGSTSKNPNPDDDELIHSSQPGNEIGGTEPIACFTNGFSQLLRQSQIDMNYNSQYYKDADFGQQANSGVVSLRISDTFQHLQPIKILEANTSHAEGE